MYNAKIITVSDSVSLNNRTDESGLALTHLLESNFFQVKDNIIVSDDREEIKSALEVFSNGFLGLIVTTGGTGFGPRDNTPEVTLKIVDRLAPGLDEAMRFSAPKRLGRLNRGVSGIRGQSLIINTPGSSKGAVESLEAVIDVLPHILDLMAGEKPH